MSSANKTMASDFILMGISDKPEFQLLIFFLILLTYLIIMGGNITVFVLVCLDHRLHTPMYFFLCNLALLDMSFSNVTLHRILVNFITGNKTISFRACMSQMCFFASLACDELLILTAMSYDRYVAICRPLQYNTVMSPIMCCILAATCWATGFLEGIPLVVQLSKVTCFRSTTINHFFCETYQIVRLPCNHAFSLQLMIFLIAGFLVAFPFLFTCIPYLFIVHTCLKIPSSTGRWKTFYTCSSHLTAVILLYSALGCQYFRPLSGVASNNLYSLLYTAVVPLLNPLIYSLKNKDVKEAFKWRCRMIS